jgi:hypothetical protein
VLYASRGHRDQRIVVSGQVFLPPGRAPKRGWPVISYAHRTVGLVNRCAPSFRHDLPVFLGEYLKAGFAFVATDYEGLGPAGPHPYLNGKSEAYGQIDIVRAARQTTTGLSRKWIAVGQSQGGQATLFTGARATTLAPELDFRGAISTAPPSDWKTSVTDTTDTGRVLTPLVLDGLTFFDRKIDPGALLTEDGKAPERRLHRLSGRHRPRPLPVAHRQAADRRVAGRRLPGVQERLRPARAADRQAQPTHVHLRRRPGRVRAAQDGHLAGRQAARQGL